MIEYKRKLLWLVCSICTIFILTGCGGKKAADFYEDGLKCMDGGNYEEAAQYFETAIQRNPERAEYYIGLGMALIEAKKYKEALKQFELVLRDKDSRIVKENNKHAYRGMGIAYFRSGKYKKAAGRFQQALEISELSGLDEDILKYQASAMENTGKSKEALECYNKLIEGKPSNSEYYTSRALLLITMGNTEDAVKDYDAAIKNRKDHYEAMIGKYLLQQSMGESEKADETIASLLSLKPKNDMQNYYLAIAKFYTGDSDAACEEFERLIDKGISDAYYYVAQIYQENGDYEKALENYLKYKEECPERLNVKFSNLVAGCYIELNEYKKALRWIKEWLDSNQETMLPELLYKEIVIYENLGEFDKAYDKILIYMERYPDHNEMEGELAFVASRVSKDKKKEIKKKREETNKERDMGIEQ